MDAIKTASKRAIQKNCIQKMMLMLEQKQQNKRYKSPEERQQIIDELRLLPKKDVHFQKLLMN